MLDLSDGDRAEVVVRDRSIDTIVRPATGRAIVDIESSTLTGIDLSDLDLSGGRLHRVTFDSCALDGARLGRARITQCRVRASSMVGLDLSEAIVRDTEVGQSKLSFGNFHGTTLARCRFIDTLLRGANFYATTFDDATIEGCDLREADFSKARAPGGLDLRGSDLEATSGLAGVGDLVVDAAQAAAIADWLLAQHRITIGEWPTS